MADIAERSEGWFARLIAVPTGAFKDAVIKQYQLAFSLMEAVDRIPAQNAAAETIEHVVRDIDARFDAALEKDVKTEEELNLIEGFTGGNLHRIREREQSEIRRISAVF